MTPEQMDDAIEGLDMLIEKRVAVVKAFMFQRHETHYESALTVAHWAEQYALDIRAAAGRLRDAHHARVALVSRRDQACLSDVEQPQ